MKCRYQKAFHPTGGGGNTSAALPTDPKRFPATTNAPSTNSPESIVTKFRQRYAVMLSFVLRTFGLPQQRDYRPPNRETGSPARISQADHAGLKILFPAGSRRDAFPRSSTKSFVSNHRQNGRIVRPVDRPGRYSISELHDTCRFADSE